MAFTWLRSEAIAARLTEETGAVGLQIDLRDSHALHTAICAHTPAPEVLVHCAVYTPLAPISQISGTEWDEAHAVNVRSAFVAMHALSRLRDIVLVSALDRNQTLPLPLPFAATQGALSAMAMAAAQELGPAVRINLVALGPLEAGFSSRLPAALLEDYLKYSALQRLGSVQEAARAITWLALDNRYMSGKVLAVNGGI